MRRFSRLWWASIALSSAVTGGGSFALLSLLTELPIATVVKISLLLILAGDIVLALIMDAMSPTRVTVGPGERWHKAEKIREFGTVVKDFDGRRGSVSVRGERWRARQFADCDKTLTVGTNVRVLARRGLTLVVAAKEQN